MIDSSWLQALGNFLLPNFWVPVIFWTVIALSIVVWLERVRTISPVHQYHSRVALQFALPLGIAGSVIFDWLNSISSTEAGSSLIVIQNPIPVVTMSPAASYDEFTFSFWLGILGVSLFSGSLIMTIKLTVDYLSLRKIDQELTFQPLSKVEILPPEKLNNTNISIAYSKEITVPFTYGWWNKRIVLPADLKKNKQAHAMAVRHELMHIKHHDYLLHGVLTFLKAIFWFHPLIHRLHSSAREYREITCDSEVLADNHFSQKEYASLLFDFAQRENHNNPAVSMAVHQSTLKKRIKLMSSLKNPGELFRSSYLITLISTCLIVLTISCTDIASDGITNSEIEQTQARIASPPSPVNSRPLYIVNGEEWNNDDESAMKLSRLKTKYIESIEVLKGEKAVRKYGDQASNGAIIMSIHNPAEAFSDLKKTAPAPTNPKESANDFFVAVEEMPELKNGLAELMQKIKYPQEARDQDLEDRVIVQFIVDKNGEVEDPQVIKGEYKVLNKEALRVVSQATFEPGKQKGQAVRVQYALPIVFRLSAD